MLFAVFLLAAAIVAFGSRRVPIQERRLTGFRAEGVAFVGAVLLSGTIGLFFSDSKTTDQSTLRAAISVVLTAVALLYVLAAVRGAKRWPPIIGDLLVLGAAYGVISLLPANVGIIGGMRLPFTTQYVNSGTWAVPLTMLWVWAISRMTAALNRTPQVTGGYLGIVAVTLLIAHYFSFSTGQTLPMSSFALASSAALAGAGLASVPVALKIPNFNIGWSASLAMGFLLAQIAVSGLFKNLAFGILLLFVLVFGLPFLDVSFYRFRAARRGQNVLWEENRLRLHEVLLRRGLSPAKVSMLYLTVAASLCALGALLVATARWNLPLRIVLFLVIFVGGFLAFFSVTRILMKRGEDEQVPDEIEAFGVRISPVSMTEAMDKVEEFIQSRKPHHVATSDANAILTAQEDEEYAAILRRAALITPDGYGVIWGARLLNLPIYERVTGVDMVTGICERAAKNNYSIYILGSAPGIASTAATNLAAKYPGLRIAGTHHGFWRRDFKEEGLTQDEADARIADQIREARPDVLFVAMGIPSQEKFIAAQLERLQVPVCLGVGGSFDVYAGKFKRAPQGVQRLGLEWVYRVWIDPSRWKRMGYVPRFMLFALKTWVFGDKAAHRKSDDSQNPKPSQA